MRRVLLITNTFPPKPGNSSEKMGTRVKFLYQHGWQTNVLTPELSPEDKADKGLLEGLPLIPVTRTGYILQKRRPSFHGSRGIFLTEKKQDWLDYFYLPNGYIRWLPFAVNEGRKLASDVDVILSFNNPTMTHLIAYFVSRLTGKPWVAGLRDPISGYHFNRKGPEVFNRFVESLVARFSTRVVQWSDFVVESMAERHPNMPRERFVSIPYTGYNPEDFEDVQKEPPAFSGPLKIAYTGSFYKGSITPETMLKAVGQLVEAKKISTKDISLTFAGDWDESYTQIINHMNLNESVHYLGFISRQACLNLWSQSHVLLVILGENFDSIHRFPAKFWEYVGAQRFILGLIPPAGRMAQLIREQNLGMVVPPHNVDAVAEAILEMLSKMEHGRLIPQPTEYFLYQEANRGHGEKILASVLDQACEQV